jgi:hypothetical protein
VSDELETGFATLCDLKTNHRFVGHTFKRTER